MNDTLELIGHLDILAAAETLRVEFRGGVVAVEIPDARTALALRRRFAGRARRREWLGGVHDVLGRAGLELQVWLGRRLVARLGAGTRSRWPARALGLDPLELDVRPLLAALSRRDRPGRSGAAGGER